MRAAHSPLLVFTAMALVCGCGRSGVLLPENEASVPFPNVPTVGGDDDDDDGATPTPDVGDGHDGSLAIDTDVSINVCHVLVTGTGAELIVGDATGLVPGRRVLTFQVQDGTAVSGSSGKVTFAGEAGRWEIGRVTDVAGTTVTLDASLASGYHTDAARAAQVCTVPEYTDVTIGGGVTLEAPDWDGASGGVVAFFATGTVTIPTTGAIDVGGSGFRGGAGSQNNGGSQNNTALDTATDIGGRKGEGIEGAVPPSSGRGNRFNGAGGGNSQEAGGGGGGNGGAGGFGGSQQGDIGRNLGCRGMGGSSVALDAQKDGLVFGGAGAGGQGDEGSQGEGGDGGGVILLFVQNLDGSGSVLARGTNGENANQDGAGGAGAGGMIVVRVFGTATWTGTFEAGGGNGGDYVGNTARRGTGGGGGGGRLLFEGLTLTTAGVPGGATGRNTQFSNDTWDATPGEFGVAIPLSDPGPAL